MLDKFYFVKRLSPWMMEELLSLSTLTGFNLILFRSPDSFYFSDLDLLRRRNVNVIIKPFNTSLKFNRFLFIVRFFIKYFSNFLQFYSFIIGVKSAYWFLRLDLGDHSSKISIHSQFATQAALVALMYREFNNDLSYNYFTFHAYDIYFKNKWFKTLTNNSVKIFSISDYNINYVKSTYGHSLSSKLVLSRLGAKKGISSLSLKENSQGNVIRLGLISWFVEKKGIFYLLEALKLFRDNQIDVKLYLAGDGPLKSDILKFIESSDLNSYVIYQGKLGKEEKVDFYNNIDVFVLPAISIPNDKDGIPVVLMEACSYGLPLISTNISGIPEVCIDHFNGLLIKEKSVEALYDAISKLVFDSKLREQYSLNSMEIFENYDIDINTKKKALLLNWI